VAVYEYDVIELRERGAFSRAFSGKGGSAPSEQLKALLNERAADGWQMKAMVSGDVTGALGGKKEGWMLIMERAKT
jgi:hypothetical protein